MESTQNSDCENLTLEDQLVGINAKTAPCPAARSWSGGRRRILGRGARESYIYHVMARTCGGEVFPDDFEKESLIFSPGGVRGKECCYKPYRSA